MKPIDVKSDSYAEYNVDSNEKDAEFKNDDHVKISKYKNFLLKDMLQIGQKKFFLLSQFKKSVPWTYVANGLNSEEIVRTFCKKELQKTNQKEFRTEKVIKRKGNKLYVKWKGYDNSFNSWIDKSDLI